MLMMFVQTEWKQNLIKNNYYPCSQSTLLLLEANGSSSQQQIKLTITFSCHLLYVRAMSCRFICKAVVEIVAMCDGADSQGMTALRVESLVEEGITRKI